MKRLRAISDVNMSEKDVALWWYGHVESRKTQTYSEHTQEISRWSLQHYYDIGMEKGAHDVEPYQNEIDPKRQTNRVRKDMDLPSHCIFIFSFTAFLISKQI